MRTRRKYRRRAELNRSENDRERLSQSDVLLMIGLTLLIIGVIVAAINYQAYTVGIPAHVSNTRYGTEYVPEIPPGNPTRETTAAYGLISAGVGALLSTVAYTIKLVSRRLSPKEESLT